MKSLWLVLALFVATGSMLFANGGAWQTGIPGTGNASASNKSQKTDVTIESETLKIDLHPEYADVTVRYRMHNTGAKVQQDFFFPVERWGRIQTADEDRESDDINRYQISVDGKELKSTNVAGPKQESRETKEGTGDAKEENSKAKEEAIEGTSEATEDSSQAEEEASYAEEGSDEEGSDEEGTGETTSGPFWQENVSTIK